MQNVAGYSKEFSEQGFWSKLQRSLRRAGREIVEKVLILIYALDDPQVPVWAKSTIVVALGYFISPIDGIPDLLPGGFADDLGVVAGALGIVIAYVSPATIQRAKAKADVLFGQGPDCT